MKMKLYGSKTSPFSRKVLVAIEELDLGSLVERVGVDPFNPPEEFLAANPLAQIPALVTEKGECLPGSALIIEYLMGRSRGLASLPRGSQRWAALRRATLADGVTEAAVAMLLESRRPPERQYLPWSERKRAAVLRGLDQLERDAAGLLAEQPSTTEISVGCALGYLDFRFPELQWRDGRPALTAWYAGFSQRPSMQRTAPPGSTI